MIDFVQLQESAAGESSSRTLVERGAVSMNKVRSSLQQLQSKLSQSAWELSTGQLSADAARGSAAAGIPRRAYRGRVARPALPVLSAASDVISRDATKYAKQVYNK